MRAVRLIALAARTPVGLVANASAAAIRAGISSVVEHPVFVDKDGQSLPCGLDATLGAAYTAERVGALASLSLREMSLALAAHRSPSGRIPVILSLPIERPGFSAADRRSILKRLENEAAGNPAGLAVEAGAAGHAGVLSSVAQTTSRIARGEMDLCVVGGADSYLEGSTLDWLEENRMIDATEVRSGFVPGEGAGRRSGRCIRRRRWRVGRGSGRHWASGAAAESADSARRRRRWECLGVQRLRLLGEERDVVVGRSTNSGTLYLQDKLGQVSRGALQSRWTPYANEMCRIAVASPGHDGTSSTRGEWAARHRISVSS